MSLHINLTEEAEHKLRTQQRRNLLAASLTAILFSALLGILLYIAVVAIPIVMKPEVTVYTQETEDAPPSDRPVTPERTTSRPSAASQAQASIITTTAITDTAVVSVDIDMPNADISQSMGPEVGTGWGGDGGSDGGGFGSVTASGSALEGTFYDFKQNQSGSPTGFTPAQAAEEMRKFVTGKWNAQMFNKYYKAQQRLYASQIYISRRKAEEAPKAYNCADKVKDSRWCAVYRGKIQAPKTGKYRFAGAGDDALVVRFNNENVFDFGWYQLTLGKMVVTPDKLWMRVMAGKAENAGIKKELVDAGVNVPPCTFYTYGTMGHWNQSLNGIVCGKTFEVKAGQVYPIEILVSEIPGGEFGAALLIEEVGVPAAKKDAKTGCPILPLFRTNYSLPDPAQIKGLGGDIVPFDEVGPVWQAVK